MDWFLPSQAVSMGLTEEFKKAIEQEGKLTPEEIAAQSRDFKHGLAIVLTAIATILVLFGVLILGLSRT